MTVGDTDLLVRVVARRALAESVDEFVLCAAGNATLPPFAAGAHINVQTPDGHRRSYSLCAPTDSAPREYVIAVDRRVNGEGGSISMHRRAVVGSALHVSSPSDGFTRHPSTSRAVLIAGGVGITAVRGLREDLRAAGIRTMLVYLVRRRSCAAYLDEFEVSGADEAPGGCDVIVHATAEHAGERLDLWPLLADPEGAELYCCGPAPLMSAVRSRTMHWRPSRLHFEDFVGVSALDPFAAPFSAVWEPTGQRVTVATDKSLLDSLLDARIKVPNSCRSGTCGTCRVRLVDGSPQHRDVVLDEQERESQLITCVSRGDGELRLAPLV